MDGQLRGFRLLSWFQPSSVAGREHFFVRSSEVPAPFGRDSRTLGFFSYSDHARSTMNQGPSIMIIRGRVSGSVSKSGGGDQASSALSPSSEESLRASSDGEENYLQRRRQSYFDVDDEGRHLDPSPDLRGGDRSE